MMIGMILARKTYLSKAMRNEIRLLISVFSARKKIKRVLDQTVKHTILGTKAVTMRGTDRSRCNPRLLTNQ